jgi:hypothetical protein
VGGKEKNWQENTSKEREENSAMKRRDENKSEEKKDS